jgi:hypothetical protein
LIGSKAKEVNFYKWKSPVFIKGRLGAYPYIRWIFYYESEIIIKAQTSLQKQFGRNPYLNYLSKERVFY